MMRAPPAFNASFVDGNIFETRKRGQAVHVFAAIQHPRLFPAFTNQILSRPTQSRPSVDRKNTNGDAPPTVV
jgi:hypothetical protein